MPDLMEENQQITRAEVPGKQMYPTQMACESTIASDSKCKDTHTYTR